MGGNPILEKGYKKIITVIVLQHKKKVRKTMNYSELEKMIILTNEDIRKTVDMEMERIDINETIDMVLSILKEMDKQELEKFRDAPLISKIAYISMEMYKYGFLSALCMYNEALKQTFADIRG